MILLLEKNYESISELVAISKKSEPIIQTPAITAMPMHVHNNELYNTASLFNNGTLRCFTVRKKRRSSKRVKGVWSHKDWA